MLLDDDVRHVLEVAPHADAVTRECPGVHAQGIVHQALDGELFRSPGQLGIGLLHDDDLFDVIDILAQQVEFAQRCALIDDELFGQLGEVSRQVLAAGVVRHECAEVVRMLLHQRGYLAETRGLRRLDLVGHHGRGYVDAVQHVADVVQHVGGDFGHAREPRGVAELLLQLVLTFVGLDSLGDVEIDSDQA